MKRIISLTIALCLVLGSFSFAFAVDWTNTDSTNLQNASNRLIYNGFSAARLLYDIDSTLSTISSNISTISSRLFYGDHSIAYYVSAINSYMNPIYLRLQDILKATTDPAFNAITGLLGYPSTDSGTGVTTWNSYLKEIYDLQNNNGWSNSTSGQGMYSTGWDGSVSVYSFNPSNNWQQNMILLLQFMNNNITQSIAGLNYKLHNDQLGVASLVDPLTLNSYSTSYISSGHMQELYLSNIGTSAARLAYVLASPERIEAQQAAADNEEVVVNNFIDSTGTGSVGVSDFGSLSDASGAMKSNFNTGQSAAGVFNVFDDSHFLYLSQSAADQLDTTGSNNSNRLLKSSGSDYDTPALDRYYEELNKILEVNKDD